MFVGGHLGYQLTSKNTIVFRKHNNYNTILVQLYYCIRGVATTVVIVLFLLNQSGKMYPYIVNSRCTNICPLIYTWTPIEFTFRIRKVNSLVWNRHNIGTLFRSLVREYCAFTEHLDVYFGTNHIVF